MHTSIDKPLINTIGIVFTLIGAILIAVDVYRRYRGKKFDVTPGILRNDYLGSDGTPVVAGQDAYETPEYIAWQRTNYWLMVFGLVAIIIGVVLQIFVSWL